MEGMSSTARATTGSSTPARPNVLFILCDDLGFGDLGVTWQQARAERGLPAFDTPHIDALAARGALLTNHSSGAPVCAPARANLLLGQHQGTCAVRDNMFDVALPGDMPSVADVFRSAGYRCAAFGKWGLAGKEDRCAHPLRRGFDEFFGYLDHRPAHYHVVGQRAPGDDPLLFEGFDPVPNADFGLSYSPDLFTARAKRFIEHNADRPWFLYLAFDTPHAQLEVPSTGYPDGAGRDGGLRWTGPDGEPRWVNTNTGRYDSHLNAGDDSWPEAARRHATIIRRIDHAVGDLMALLSDLGVAEHTVVVFTSDNGPHGEGSQPFGEQDPAFFESWGPYDGMKRDVLQGGHVVPTVAWGPGRVASGVVDATPSAFCDWMATFAQWTGQTVPASCDGDSLAELLAGGTPRPGERVVYTEYSGPNMGLRNDEILRRHALPADARRQQQSVQVGDLVAVRYAIENEDTPVRLYHVGTDAAQVEDLAGDPEHTAVAERMRRLLLTTRRPRAGAPRPYDAAWLPAVPDPGDVASGLVGGTCPVGGEPWLPRGGTWEDPRPWSGVGHLTVDVDRLAQWSGLVRADTGGRHEFLLTGTGEVALWLHDTRWVDPVDLGAAPATVAVALAPGWHPIRIVARGGTGQAARIRLAWRPPGAERFAEVPGTAFGHPVAATA